MVFYRKYRPQIIDDLDSKVVRETLHAILQKDVPHAFLFTGPKGLGKTSTARIVAKVVNCESRNPAKGGEPCNNCQQCLSIIGGINLDVLEIDAASNRGIDEIRELKEKIRLAPVSASKKVYIIDEVHMLTTEAFNALLKTLEEPPEHAMFILCTTEPYKVPATIMSRCFHITFKPATEEELVRSFKRIIKGEKIAITDEALHYIAQLADRGFRDGVKILEEIALLANGQKITKELVEKNYKVSSSKALVLSMIESLQKNQIKESLQLVTQLIEQGIDIKYFLQQFMQVLHELLLAYMQIQTAYEKAPIQLSLEQIKGLSNLISRAYFETKTSVLPQLPLELAIIEWCEKARKHAEQNAEPRTPQHQKKFVQINSASSSASVSDLRKQVGTMKKLKALYGTPSSTKNTQDKEVSLTTTTVELIHTPANGTITKEWLDHFWTNLISEMKKHNHTVAGVLRGCAIKSYSDQNLVIQTSYKFHKERLDDIKNREALVRISKLLTGKDIEITVELMGK